MKSPFNSECVYVVFIIGYFTKVVFPIPITYTNTRKFSPTKGIEQVRRV